VQQAECGIRQITKRGAYGTHAIAAATMTSEIRFAEEQEVRLRDRRRKVLLECDGESYDFRSVHVLSTRLVVREIEVIKLICPRCGAKHQSLLFA
jgi:hypothetical protein